MVGNVKPISFDGQQFVVIENDGLGAKHNCRGCLYTKGGCHRAPIDCLHDDDGTTVFWFREPTAEELKIFLEALVKSTQFAAVQGAIITHQKTKEEVVNALSNIRDMVARIERFVK